MVVKNKKSPFLSKDEVRTIKRNMARDKNQVLMFNESELSLIKATFADNDDLLYIIRKVLLQFDLTPEEGGIVRAISPEVYAVVKKRVYPDWSDDYPFSQIPSFLTSLTTDIRQRKEEDMVGLFEAKEIEMDYLEQQFNVLKDEKVEQKIKLVDLAMLKGKDSHQKFVDLTAYLYLMGHIDPMLNFIKNLAGQKNETPAQQKERLLRNSNK